ncbi:hypothetical protein ABT352_35470 [Streptosporangium sp. NPDC000563]|uniref:hypothetical protein n=1 Tax=unclassified Streptosporangium TaxID=2632669 RepID=UPI0033169EED
MQASAGDGERQPTYRPCSTWGSTPSPRSRPPGRTAPTPAAKALAHTSEPSLANVPPGPPANVAALYLEVARAITEEREAYPSFHTAVRQHRVLAAIENASRTGVRQTLAS